MTESQKLNNLERAVIAQRNKCLMIEAKKNNSEYQITEPKSQIYADENNIIASKEELCFRLNFPLVSIKYMSNEDIQSTVFTIARKYSKFQFQRGKKPKLCIWITQFIPVTLSGKIKVDVDNSDVKGIIDGIAKALQMDDNGSNISLHIEILPIDNREKPYTQITIVEDKKIKEAFKSILAASGSEPQ